MFKTDKMLIIIRDEWVHGDIVLCSLSGDMFENFLQTKWF